jgi:hypothetical protein
MGTRPVAASLVDELMKCTNDVAGSPNDEMAFERWHTAVDSADSRVLIEVTARLSSEPGKRTRDIKALREAIIAEIERKNANNIIDTMQKLDTSATRLTWASLLVAVVGVILAVIQVWESVK